MPVSCKKRLVAGAATLVAAVLSSGCRTRVVHHHHVVHTSEAEVVEIRSGPPEAPVDVVSVRPVRPAPGYVWVRGHYVLVDGEFVWVRGRWVTPPPRAARWVPGHVVVLPHGQRGWRRGHWIVYR